MGIMVIHHGSIMWRDPYLLAFSPNLTSSQRHGKCHVMWYAMEAYHVAYQIHTIMHLDPQHTHAMLHPSPVQLGLVSLSFFIKLMKNKNPQFNQISAKLFPDYHHRIINRPLMSARILRHGSVHLAYHINIH